MTSKERNKLILVICPHPVGYVPGQRLKFEQYFETWQAAGYEVDVSSFMSEQMQQLVYLKGHFLAKISGTFGGYIRRFRDLFKLKKYDIVYVFLWVTPFGPPFFEYMFRGLASKIVYDIDDLIYMKSTSPANKFIKILKSDRKVNFLMKNADHILVSTDKLMHYARQFNTNISLIPATVDVKRYPYPVDRKTSETVVLGWSGSHTTSKYLHLLDNVLKKLSEKYLISIEVMGDKSFAIDGLPVKLIEWAAATEVQSLQQFDIGLHPLPDEEWVYGKSGGKLVQYMAAGLPMVASALGPNFKAIKEGYNGFLAASDEEWVEKLSLLIEDKALRKQMGERSRQFAEEHYSVEANSVKYLSVFNNL
jgi:glycosyltransferase involved in cell wall biosynthesis